MSRRARVVPSVLAAAIVLAAIAGAGQGRVTRECAAAPPASGAARRSDAMDRKEWMERKLDGLHRDEVSAFTRGLRERLRDPARATVRMSQDESAGLNAPPRLNAFDVAFRLGDQAIVPLVELPPPEDPKDRRQRFSWAIDEEVKLRRKVIEQVDRLLSEKTALPPAPDAGANVAAAPPRVCDAGYVLLRKLVYFGDKLPEPYAGEAAFYALPEAERDGWIARARSTVLWQRLLHGNTD